MEMPSFVDKSRSLLKGDVLLESNLGVSKTVEPEEPAAVVLMISVAIQSKYCIQWKNFQDDVTDYQPKTKQIQRRHAKIRNRKKGKNQQSTQLFSARKLLLCSG